MGDENITHNSKMVYILKFKNKFRLHRDFFLMVEVQIFLVTKISRSPC